MVNLPLHVHNIPGKNSTKANRIKWDELYAWNNCGITTLRHAQIRIYETKQNKQTQTHTYKLANRMSVTRRKGGKSAEKEKNSFASGLDCAVFNVNVCVCVCEILLAIYIRWYQGNLRYKLYGME